jgi:hypothetical protein
MGQSVMLAFEDTFEQPPVPLVAAFVDNCVSVTLDADGNSLRDAAEVTRPPDPTSHADLRLVDPPNRGSDRAAFVGLGEAMTEPPRDVERLTPRFLLNMMRRDDARQIIPPPAGTAVVMRASGARSKKPIKWRKQEERPGREVGGYVPFFRVSGLTPGERDFFHRRPNIARTLIREVIIGKIVNDELVEPIVKVERMRFAFDILGLEDYELQMIRQYRNAVRMALIDHARAIDPMRVQMIDGNAPSSSAPKMHTYERVTLGEYA